MTDIKMQAVRIHQYGGLEVLLNETVDRPEPIGNQVLIRLKTAGVNPVDLALRAGYLHQFMPLQFPWTVGLEGAGTIEAIGPEVTRFQVGQPVFGLLLGGYAEYAVAHEGDLQPIPTNINFEQAATIAHGALTAWGAVFDAAQVKAGQRVLVQGASGGVGLYAVQLAHWKGAHVVGTTSTANVEFVRSLGADEVIDYSTVHFEDVLHDLDAVIDTVGGDIPERSLKILRSGGVFTSVVVNLDPEKGRAKEIRVSMASRASVDHLAEITHLVASGQLKPAVRKIFSLPQARQAQELSQAGHGRGRIILHISD
jgi:NADPH:quinone reductase-like Zn-dependent oxidoreductase